ncbi:MULTISPECIES: ComF family protein [unclassified Butyrivibrio]|uniref:ComF family protein n=1 Tax=unclassified Butyrivibrio TaxID=2639466 RepID=UPI00088BCB7C|nr:MULTISPECIES: ComF family protein [unclassified Butyrivibrio]SDB37814.1 comF family protein [Butyrivibrio sp. INlla16]SEK81736.1 comF family protein [Butyrivibrio sp. ob235]
MQAEELLEGVISILYPRRCPVCDTIVKRKEGLIHPECKRVIKPAGKIICMKCGKPLSDADKEYCPDCEKTRHYFDRGFGVFRYRSISGSIYRFKYSGRREYADYYGEAAMQYLGKAMKAMRADAVIPVPMYDKKQRKRGYNQAEVFADALGKRIGVPVRNDIVRRVRDTVPMKMLDSSERRSNLKKAFNISQNDVKFKCIILVDDIYTTGSTMDELAREFRRHGVERIFFVTLAIGQVV